MGPTTPRRPGCRRSRFAKRPPESVPPVEAGRARSAPRSVAAAILVFSLGLGPTRSATAEMPLGGTIALPKPRTASEVSVERALRTRRSVREYARKPLSLAEVAQLLWAAQGITSSEGGRTAPSAGALYPLELYLVAGAVSGLEPGVYRYRPEEHDLVAHAGGDLRRPVARAALDQGWIADGGAILVFAGVYGRTTRKYGQRGSRYVHMEVGHAAQNVYLQAIALGLGTVMVGAFDDGKLRQLLRLRSSEDPLALMPVGR